MYFFAMGRTKKEKRKYKMAVSEQLRVYLECNPSLKYQNLQKNSLGFKFSPHISFPEPPQSVCTGLVLCMTEICYF